MTQKEEEEEEKEPFDWVKPEDKPTKRIEEVDDNYNYLPTGQPNYYYLPTANPFKIRIFEGEEDKKPRWYEIYCPQRKRCIIPNGRCRRCYIVNHYLHRKQCDGILQFIEDRKNGLVKPNIDIYVTKEEIQEQKQEENET